MHFIQLFQNAIFWFIKILTWVSWLCRVSVWEMFTGRVSQSNCETWRDSVEVRAGERERRGEEGDTDLERRGVGGESGDTRVNIPGIISIFAFRQRQETLSGMERTGQKQKTACNCTATIHFDVVKIRRGLNGNLLANIRRDWSGIK